MPWYGVFEKLYYVQVNKVILNSDDDHDDP